jgi:hypothetical protein
MESQQPKYQQNFDPQTGQPLAEGDARHGEGATVQLTSMGAQTQQPVAQVGVNPGVNIGGLPRGSLSPPGVRFGHRITEMPWCCCNHTTWAMDVSDDKVALKTTMVDGMCACCTGGTSDFVTAKLDRITHVHVSPKAPSKLWCAFYALIVASSAGGIAHAINVSNNNSYNGGGRYYNDDDNSRVSSGNQATYAAVVIIAFICAYETFKYCLRRVVVTMSGDEFFSIPQASLEAGHMLTNSIISRQLAK